MKIDAILKAVAIVGIISIAISAVYYFAYISPQRQKADEPTPFIKMETRIDPIIYEKNTTFKHLDRLDELFVPDYDWPSIRRPDDQK